MWMCGIVESPWRIKKRKVVTYFEKVKGKRKEKKRKRKVKV
jgi:hypothetical protein